MNTNKVIKYFDVVLFMNQKQRRKQNKTQKQGPPPQKKNKKAGKKNKRVTEKEKAKIGEAKKGGGKTKGDTQNKTRMPFFGGGNTGFSMKNKRSRGKKNKN